MTEKTDYRPAGRERQGLASRQIAAKLLNKIVNDRQSLADLFHSSRGHSSWQALITKDRALTRAIVTTAIRRRRQIECALSKVMDRKPPRNAHHLMATLHVAAAQILYMNIPDRAAVSLAVTALREEKRSARFAGFGNAVLRRVSAEQEPLIDQCSAWQLSFPNWLAKRVRSDFGRENSERIASAVLAGPALDVSLRPDLDNALRIEIVEALSGIALPNNSVRVNSDKPVDQLPGYDDGLWWVQDFAASLPVQLLGPLQGLEIADLCAAPGGKTAQLAAAGAKVTAIDKSERRLELLRQNLGRLNLSADIVHADILEWRPEKQFDGVILDAPCSATGTIRRHPDVPWVKSEADIVELSRLQTKLIQHAFSLAKPGAPIVYVNCSILKQEGEDLVVAFANMVEMRRHAGISAPVSRGEFPTLDPFINGQGALRTLPFYRPDPLQDLVGMDGFFATRFKAPDLL